MKNHLLPKVKRPKRVTHGALYLDKAMADLFLSHSSKDKPFARKLAERLAKAGADVWLDEAELQVGDSLLQKLALAIHEVDFVTVVISTNSVDSDWVNKELQLAMARELAGNKKVVHPILIDGAPLPYFLADKLYADFSDNQSFDDSFLRLMRAIDGETPNVLEYLRSLDISRFTRR